jgi:large subunit ribosomal protein L1
MPNPKVGTVVGPEEVALTVQELKRGKIDFRVEKAGIIHVSIGRVSMDAQMLSANLTALVSTLVRLKPSSAKGTYLRSIAVSSTMGPGVRVDTHDAQRDADGN